MNSEADLLRRKRPILSWFAYVSPVIAILVALTLLSMSNLPSQPNRAAIDQISIILLASSVVGLLFGITGLLGAAANGVGTTLVAVLGILLNALAGFVTFWFAALSSISRC